MRRYLIPALLALFVLAPFATSASADGDAFLDRVAAILRRAVDAERMDATDARAVYNAIADQVALIERRIAAARERACDDLGDAKTRLKAALRKAKAEKKCEKAKARLSRYAAKLKDAVDRARCSVEKAQRKWATVFRKLSGKLDETTLARLKAYYEDLKGAVENGRITKREAFDLFVAAVRRALAAQEE